MKRAGELLASFFDQQTFDAAREYSDLFLSWRSIAGEALAAHSRIRELEHSVLLVEADHPGWIQILQTREKDLLDALRRRFPDRHITGISFRLSREPLSSLPTRAFPADRDESAGGMVSEPPAAADSAATTGDLYEKIGDEHFREALKRLEQSIKRKG
jgi:predicted nucleic acid-binding Zn ribbon protein